MQIKIRCPNTLIYGYDFLCLNFYYHFNMSNVLENQILNMRVAHKNLFETCTYSES